MQTILGAAPKTIAEAAGDASLRGDTEMTVILLAACLVTGVLAFAAWVIVGIVTRSERRTEALTVRMQQEIEKCERDREAWARERKAISADQQQTAAIMRQMADMIVNMIKGLHPVTGLPQNQRARNRPIKRATQKQGR